jgi:hypothetical protein
VAKMIEIYDRLLPLLQIINSGLNDITTLKNRYKQLCDKQWNSNCALDKAFSRDINLLIASNLVEKNRFTINKTPRLQRIFGLSKNINMKKELLKIYINATHCYLLEGEHITSISKNLEQLDSLILESNEKMAS